MSELSAFHLNHEILAWISHIKNHNDSLDGGFKNETDLKNISSLKLFSLADSAHNFDSFSVDETEKAQPTRMKVIELLNVIFTNWILLACTSEFLFEYMRGRMFSLFSVPLERMSQARWSNFFQ